MQKARIQHILLLTAFLPGASLVSEAQIKNLHHSSHKIPDSLVNSRQVRGVTVRYVDEKHMREGWNVFSHQPGRFIYVDYKNAAVRGYYVSDTTGRVMAGIFFLQDTSYYHCSESICGCTGDKNCDSLFGSAACKEDLVCVGSTCMCTRPVTLPDQMKKSAKSPDGVFPGN